MIANHCAYYMNTKAKINSIYLTPKSSEEILEIITSLKGKKSSGYDRMNPIILSVCVPLASIINKSLETGEIVNCLKLAKVVHIYKSKNKEEFRHY